MPVMAPNAQVFQEIVNAINSGKFYINVGETGNAIVYAIPNTVARISSPPSRRTFTSSTSSTSSSGYSSGAMAGVGVGTLVVGLFLGILTIFLVKKLYLSNKNSDMSMKTLSSDQEPSKF
uniref:Uncharacterized protein n=1 Tax=Biomphalaria glabrata TaxID=6526 RepID=A0A2C9LP60_BIOGL